MNHWLDKKIVCICEKKDTKRGVVVYGSVVLGGGIQFFIVGLSIVLLLLDKGENISFIGMILTIVLAIIMYDTVVFSRKYHIYKKDGHKNACSRKLAMADVLKSGPVV